MSIVGHFSVFDRKAQEYAPIFTAKNSDVARRMIVQSLSGDSLLCQYPGDYTLVHVSDFDTETGALVPLDGAFAREVGHLVDLIPDELKKFAVDGSFIKE